MKTSSATLVLGATGATGHHVVQQLLDLDLPVRTIVRSKQRMLDALPNPSKADELLSIKEASLLDLPDEELKMEIDQVDTAVSCLGPNPSFQGVWGEPRRLVTDSVKRVTTLMASSSPNQTKKFLLMSSELVSHPAGIDGPRKSVLERFILFLLRHLIPPHVDNEEAVAYLHNHVDRSSNVQWVAIRPTSLIDADEASEYKLMDKPFGLFAGCVATRTNVAKCMVDMITDDKLFEENKMCMPVLHDSVQPEKK